MYVKGKKELYTAKMNPARGMTLCIMGVIFIVLGLVFLVAGIMVANTIIISSARNRLLIISVIAALLFFEMGGSAIVNGVAFRAVSCIVYDEGVAGTSAVVNSICGLFTKTKAFDIDYSDIALFRLENNVLLIQTKTDEHRFQFREEDNRKIYDLLMEHCSN